MTEASLLQQEVFYSGHVQGVGFRYTVRTIAAGFDVTGFVRNLSDGRVQLVAEGSPDEIDSLLGAVKSEMDHYITDVDETQRPATGKFQSFDIRF